MNSITVGELFAIMAGCVSLFFFLKHLIVPLVQKWLKVEDNSKRLKDLPGIIATQQKQIDDINLRLERGNSKFDILEENVIKNNSLLTVMNAKLVLLVEDRAYSQPVTQNSEMLKTALEKERLGKLQMR